MGPICEQFTKGVWEIAALAEGYVLLAIKWGSNVSAEKHPFYYFISSDNEGFNALVSSEGALYVILPYDYQPTF